MTSELDLVGSIPLLRGLDEECLRGLTAEASLRRYPKDTVLFSAGERAECLHILLSGSVEVFSEEAGKVSTILIMFPADAFMPAAALVDEPYLTSARTLKMSKLLLLRADAVRAEMARCPDLACRLAKLLSGQLRMMLKHIKDLKTRSGPQRLAAFLLSLVDSRGMAGGAELPFPKGTLASRLGMSPETLSRNLQVVADNGIMVRGHRVVLKDRETAEAFCNATPLIDGGETGLYVQAW
jgi:CRP/FNR family transcriptional activator FtrB